MSENWNKSGKMLEKVGQISEMALTKAAEELKVDCGTFLKPAWIQGISVLRGIAPRTSGPDMHKEVLSKLGTKEGVFHGKRFDQDSAC